MPRPAGDAADRAERSGLLRVTLARMGQLIDFTLLAPAIREDDVEEVGAVRQRVSLAAVW